MPSRSSTSVCLSNCLLSVTRNIIYSDMGILSITEPLKLSQAVQSDLSGIALVQLNDLKSLTLTWEVGPKSLTTFPFLGLL